MRVFNSLDEIPKSSQRAAVAIGNFDGVHRGHQKILSHMLEASHEAELIPTVLTFHPHPVEVLRPGTKLERITTTEEKLALFKQYGVKQVLVQNFGAELAALSPEDFFQRFLANGLRAASLHVGYDFHFGAKRAGDTQALEKLCSASSMELQVEPPFELGPFRISSSLIREALRLGEVVKAADYLGRSYAMSGKIIEGDKRGRQLGYPTANLDYPAEKVLPKYGVYLTLATWKEDVYGAVTNIGVRPTFGGAAGRPSVETHLLDFDSSLYDETLTIDFVDRIRDEKKFDSVDALKRQIEADVARAKGKN